MQDAELPTNWVLATNDDLGEFINGFAFKPADRTEHGTPIIRIQNLTDPLRPFNYTVKEVNQKYVVKRGNILVSWSATLDAFRWDGPRAYVNQHIFKVVPAKQLSSRFVFFALKESINELTNSEHLHGTTMKHVNRKPFLAHPVGLPPLNEQHRIVEKIETLFAQIDKGEEALREVRKLLKRYRQSILKAAVTGELTRDWRKANQHKLEPASDFLARILEARRENWQGRGKYKEAVIPETGDLPELPDGWLWASLSQLTFLKGGVTVDRKRTPTDPVTLPYLRVANVQNGYLDLSEIKEITVSRQKAEECLLQPGDILLNEGGDRDKLGRGWVWDAQIDPCLHQNHVFRARPVLPELQSEFISYYSNAFGQPFFMTRGKQSVNLASISLTAISALPVPLPSVDEQKEIVNRLKIKLVEIESAVLACEAELERSTALRQSILKSAFTGQLVPQDPNDEPASELLARIRAEREATPTAKARRKARA